MATQATVSRLLLRNVPLFALLSEDQLAVLSTVVNRRNTRRGATIIAAGDVTDSLYIVISGKLKVAIRDKTGREVILAILGPGEHFGEMLPIDDGARSANVISLEPCELLALSSRDFKKCLAENFDTVMTVMRCLVRRLRQADRKISSLALMDVYGRVARQLLDMSESIDGQQVVTQKIVKHDMARMIGASREMVSRVMKDLEAGGVIKSRGTATYLRDDIAAID